MSEIVDRGAGTSNLLHTVGKGENRGTLGGTGHGLRGFIKSRRR